MKIFYEVDLFTDNCKYKCPFKDVGYKGETGEDCQVGSITCQECKFCYGYHHPKELDVVFINSEPKLRQVCYIKCMFGCENDWKKKIQKLFYDIKYWLLTISCK